MGRRAGDGRGKEGHATRSQDRSWAESQGSCRRNGGSKEGVRVGMEEDIRKKTAVGLRTQSVLEVGKKLREKRGSERGGRRDRTRQPWSQMAARIGPPDHKPNRPHQTCVDPPGPGPSAEACTQQTPTTGRYTERQGCVTVSGQYYALNTGYLSCSHLEGILSQ